jgi:hypothetical protein
MHWLVGAKTSRCAAWLGVYGWQLLRDAVGLVGEERSGRVGQSGSQPWARRIMEATADTFYMTGENRCARRSMENTSVLAKGIEVGLRSKQVLTCGRGF